MSPEVGARLLLLLVAVNGAPIVARWLLGRRLAAPVDGGLRLSDGRRLLGEDKTWRGIAAAVLAGAAAAPLLGWGAGLGAALGVASMAGDLLSSFVKRRLGMAAGRSAPGLDQLPESALPLLVLRERLALDGLEVLALSVAFTLVDLALSPLLARLGLRDRGR